MGTNKTEAIRFAPHGQLYIAALANQPTMPMSPTAPLGPEWLGLGYVSKDGVELTPSVETQALEAWQAASPVLYTVTSAGLSVKATLLQNDPVTTALYFGTSWRPMTDSTGNPVTGVSRLAIESNPHLTECAMVVDWGDNAVHNRLVIPRGMVNAREALKLTRTDAQQLGITYQALDADGILGSILTDDPAMAASSPVVVPTLTLTPSSAAAGATVTLSGANWGSTAPTLSVGGANGSKFTFTGIAVTGGVLSGSMKIDATTPTGSYTVTATGSNGSKNASFTVTA